MMTFKVLTPLQTAIFANRHAQRMADDVSHALRNVGVKAKVDVVLKDGSTGVIANIEINGAFEKQRSVIENALTIMYEDKLER